MKYPLGAILALILSAATLSAAKPELNPVVWNNDHTSLPDGVTHHSFQSASMGREIGYTVFLPPGYKSSQKRYPTIYFLHGFGGNENSDGPAFSGYVAKAIKSGRIPPVICIFPNGGRSGYRDHPDTKIMVETMIIKELIPLIDHTYRTLDQRDSRAIAGFSMGGGGAIRLALGHPDLFSAAGSWAGGFSINRKSAILAPETSAAHLRVARPLVRLLLIVGYEDEASYAFHAPFIKALTEASYPYTFQVLANVHHNLGLYYKYTAKEMVQFLAGKLATKSEK